jgi:tripeptide aminopeptidase
VGAIETPQRRYLSGTFAELCRIESPSGCERRCAERVKAELRGLGIETEEDRAGELTGSDCGNLLARLPPAAQARADSRVRSVLMCAHLDTVPLQAPVEPMLSEGVWENANEDPRRRQQGRRGRGPRSPASCTRRARPSSSSCCSRSARSARSPARRLRRRAAAQPLRVRVRPPSPIGEVITRSPSHFRLEARFHGAAAHAAIRPEDGRNAIVAAARAIASLPAGRVDEQSTVNIASIGGGGPITSSPTPACSPARSAAMTPSGARSWSGRSSSAFTTPPTSRLRRRRRRHRREDVRRLPPAGQAVVLAAEGLRRAGYEPTTAFSGGAADANVFNERGLPCVNLANGTQHPHEPSERVSDDALAEMLEVALAIVESSAALEPSPAR